MNLKNRKIGIWGFGIVGKSLLRFLSKFTDSITIMDHRLLNQEEKKIITSCNALYYEQSKGIEPFLKENELLCVSAGIDIRNYQAYHHKLLPELDLFHHFFKKPIIALTGTIGKTTTTTLISQLLRHNGFCVATGGNIGIGLMDLVTQQDQFDCAVLELSSFQLEYCKTFAPDIAVWTNFFPNHLDRHGTIQDYFTAKSHIYSYQTLDQIVIASHQMSNMLKPPCVYKYTYGLYQQDTPMPQFFISNQNILFKKNNSLTTLGPLPIIPDMFIENVLLACITAYVFDPHKVWDFQISTPTLIHRMEYLGSRGGAHFYNDSKSTVPQSTLAALKNLDGKPILLFLGGLSKGIDRSAFIEQLPKHIKHIMCFGKEAEQLHMLAQKQNLKSSNHPNLEEAFDHCLDIMQKDDYILFSPAGSSYDLFKDYQERGNAFKALVQTLNVSH